MYADVVFHEQPDWSQRPGRRLAVSFLPASLIVAGVLATLRMPVVGQTQPVAELRVQILVNDVVETVHTPFVDEPVPEVEEAVEPSTVVPPIPAEPVTGEAREPTDWYLQIPEAAKAVLDARSRTYSVNPGFDEKRRAAAEQFRPSEAPVERPIWENVERDTLGRTILVSGDCYRVLDDPNVGSREAFLTFGQYITSCAYYKRPPQKLPFVDEINNRRASQARYAPRAAE
jgi:hypothetical protein